MQFVRLNIGFYLLLLLLLLTAVVVVAAAATTTAIKPPWCFKYVGLVSQRILSLQSVWTALKLVSVNQGTRCL